MATVHGHRNHGNSNGHSNGNSHGKSNGNLLLRNLLLFKTVIAGDSWGLIAVPVIETLGLRATPSGAHQGTNKLQHRETPDVDTKLVRAN